MQATISTDYVQYRDRRDAYYFWVVIATHEGRADSTKYVDHTKADALLHVERLQARNPGTDPALDYGYVAIPRRDYAGRERTPEEAARLALSRRVVGVS